MSEKICRYCKKPFQPSRFHPEQEVCGAPECQRRRRADYHRRKLAEDCVYREQCRDSQKTWREKNPEYLQNYRAARRRRSGAEPVALHLDLRGSATLAAKNNVASALKHCHADISVILTTATGNEKNTLADSQVILLKGSCTLEIVSNA